MARHRLPKFAAVEIRVQISATRHLKTRDDLLKVDVAGLIKQMIGTKDVKIKYYTTTLQLVTIDEDMQKRSEDMIAWTALWTNHLLDQGIEIIKAGKLMARRLVIDGRNICKPDHMRELDFEYFSFGREQVRAVAHQAAR